MAGFDEGRRVVGHFGIKQVSAGRRSDPVDLLSGFDEDRELLAVWGLSKGTYMWQGVVVFSVCVAGV